MFALDGHFACDSTTKERTEITLSALVLTHRKLKKIKRFFLSSSGYLANIFY
jgi:hypothetical protein